MPLKVVLTCLLVVFRAPTYLTFGVCSRLPEYSKLHTSCFRLYTELVPWDQAQAQCQRDGGHLASIHSEIEQVFVSSLLVTSETWIGLKSANQILNWVDGTQLDYTYWNQVTLEPNWTGECVRMKLDGTWADDPCTTMYASMCRVDEQLQTWFTLVSSNVPNEADQQTWDFKTSFRIECAIMCAVDEMCTDFTVSEGDGEYIYCDTFTSTMGPSQLLEKEHFEKTAIAFN